MMPPNIISGFRETGIFLLNDDTVTDSAFTPSDITLLQLSEKHGRGVEYDEDNNTEISVKSST
jgi:hypothetical protein